MSTFINYLCVRGYAWHRRQGKSMKNAGSWLTGVLVFAGVIYLVSVGWFEKRPKPPKRP